MNFHFKLYTLTLTLILILGRAKAYGNKCKETMGHCSASDGHYKRSTAQTIQIGEESNQNFEIFENLLSSNDLQVDSKRFKEAIQKIEISKSCDSLVKNIFNCDFWTLYRTMNGSCNNLIYSKWGRSFTPFNRILPPAYDGGYNLPRGGYESSLPNPRKISTTIHPDLIIDDPMLTNMVPQFGQFLDHDLTFTPDHDCDCCLKKEEERHRDCWPIKIPIDDPFYSRSEINQSCLSFTRSTAFCFPLNKGIRQQANTLTAFVDGSQVYGSDDLRAGLLREMEGGRLKANQEMGNFLPTVKEIGGDIGKDICGTYAAGDNRVNEMPGLTTLHVLFFREHNRLAGEIFKFNSQLSDEVIFQNARRILIGQYQKIVYGEYLPVILGRITMAQYDLNVDPGNLSQYDPTIDPSIIHAFATAAYRFGHSLVNGLVRMMRNMEKIQSYRVRNGFFNDSHIKFNHGEGYDLILQGLIQQCSQKFDRFVTEDLTNFLFRPPKQNYGQDLLARNIQRGRDHGLPPYFKYRKICKLAPLTTWSHIPVEFDADTWRKLGQLYESPLDIDLFSGGLAELPLKKSLTGPTFNCIKAIQFQRLKFGDRFFYSHSGLFGTFTRDQIEILSKRTLGDIICENSQLAQTTTNVFYKQSSQNPFILCNDTSRQVLNVADFL